MGLKHFIIISVVAHSLLFISVWSNQNIKDDQKPQVRLNLSNTVSEKNLNKTNTKQTKKTSSKPTPNKKKSASLTYKQELINFIRSKAIYPKSARALRQEGFVMTRITIAKSGKILEFKITKKSKFSSLNFAASEIIKSIHQYKPLPERFKKPETFEISINYILN